MISHIMQTIFYTMKIPLKQKGTGLGMMVSFQVIRSFKGRIRVESEEGVGTEFFIEFPRIET